LLNPQLTTIREFPELLGSQLVELVLSRIAEPELPPRQVTIPTEIIKRESCASLATVPMHAMSKN
jgi:DNA-binding LacI/PurR family transcriptional regulator